MGDLRIGDIVARKSYGGDILFKITDIKSNGKENIITLKGVTYRIQADAPETDLMTPSRERIDEHHKKCCIKVDRKLKEIESYARGDLKKAFFRSTSKEGAVKFPKPGKILHVDGDNDYLENCMSRYKKLKLDVIGKYITEKDQPSSIGRLLREVKPDILVLTGHDGVLKGENNYSKLDNYRNSRYFIEAVKEARKYEDDLDSLVIFAGACQSMYNGIIGAGANFASSPYRVLIHALDPVIVAQKIALTSINNVIEPTEVINSTITGVEGIGGLQTRGKYRNGFPLEPYSN